MDGLSPWPVAIPLISTRKPAGLTVAPALLTSNSSVFVPATKVDPNGIAKEVNVANPAEVMPVKSVPLRRTAARPLSVATCPVIRGVAGSRPVRSKVVLYV